MTLALITDVQRACPQARTDRALVTQATTWLAQAVEAGIDLIQIREHDLAAVIVRDLTRSVVALCGGTSTRVLVNNRADVALVAGAHGVHLRDDGWSIARVRTLNSGWMISRSIHDETRPPTVDAPDVLVFGAVFGSAGKPARGLAALRTLTAACRVPVVAIGGITLENAASAVASGASGVAAISLFLPRGIAPTARGPAESISRLRALAGNV